MTLEAGKRLGPYEIVRPLGAGGMGEVYKARDTRLDRTVAIKVLPSHLSDDLDRRQRLEREAKAISALSHPHICVLHDIGHQDGILFLVMEYLEGETLADRLSKGALPLDQVLRYGIQIAEALDKAHRQGIVHRDLKPGNVMLTKSGAKLLDFGLAKLRPAGPQTPAASQLTGLPTEDKPLTAEGSLIGTFQYMAPEQLEGNEPDARTDIFALGTLLYEMATGQRAFTGKSQASLIAAILASDPAPLSRLQPLTPPALERVVAICLKKDPDERWQSAHDLASELAWISQAGSQAGVAAPVAAKRRGRERLAWTAAIVGSLLGVGLGFALAQRRHVPPPAPEARFQIVSPDKVVLYATSAPVLSPDGANIAFSAFQDGSFRLFVRPLRSLVATPVAGAEGGAVPFWSANSRRLGFFARGKLMSTDVSGGSPHTICDLAAGFVLGATWNQQDVVVFSNSGQLFRVPAGGGRPEPLGKPGEGETGRFWPHFLPDGRRYLYVTRGARPQDRGIYVASLDSDERKRIGPSDHNAAYAASGHLLFVRGDVLTAQAFDVKTLELSGEPIRVSDQVMLTSAGNYPGAAYSVSGSGLLALRTGSTTETQLVWFDRSGKKLGTVGELASYSNPALSPHEQSLAVGRIDPGTRTRDIWVFDLVRGARTRLTFDPADDTNPTWSPDGTKIAFSSDRQGLREIYEKPANGSAAEELLLPSKEGSRNVEDWSPDGRLLLYNHGGAERPADLHLLPLGDGERKPVIFLATRFGEQMGQFAPSAAWIAYSSNESGANEVYVQTFSTTGAGRGKWQVSTAGGSEPRWRRDGKELFFLAGSTLMAVSVKSDGASFEAGIPRPLFDVRLALVGRNRYVVTRDGQRFLVNMAVSDVSGAGPIEVIVNWLPGKQ